MVPASPPAMATSAPAAALAAETPAAREYPVWSWIGVIVVVAAAVRLFIGPFVVDDAFITFRYAREIAASSAFAYNPGERVLGTTTPLFTLLLAGAFRAGWPLSWTAVVISTLADAATIVLVSAWLVRVRLAYAAPLVAGMLAIWPFLVTYAVAGLETSLYTLLVYGLLVAAAGGRAGLAGVLAGLGALCRPDAGIAVMVAFVWLLRRPRQARLFCGIVAVLVAPWLVFAHQYFGSVIPHSVVAKAALDRERLVGLTTFLGFFAGSPKYIALSACAVAGAAVLWARGGALGRLLLIWGTTYAVIFIVSNAFSDFPWYFAPLMPLYLAAIAVFVGQLAIRAVETVRPPGWVRAPATVTALLAGLLAAGVWHVRGLDGYLRGLAAGREDLYARTASWIAEKGPGEVVAATEVGTIGYFYPGPILDLVGLVSPGAVNRDPLDALLEADAAWLVTYDTHFPRGVTASDRFRREFELVSRSPVSPERALEVYRRRPKLTGRV